MGACRGTLTPFCNSNGLAPRFQPHGESVSFPLEHPTDRGVAYRTRDSAVGPRSRVCPRVQRPHPGWSACSTACAARRDTTPPMPEANGDGRGACADRVDSFQILKDLAGCGNSTYRAPNVTFGGCAGEQPSSIHGLGRIRGPLILLVTYEPVAMLFR